MSSTLCVRCGSDLVPLSYCKVCNQVVKLTCSSCDMISDERIHIYCKPISSKIYDYDESIHLRKEWEREKIPTGINESESIQKNEINHDMHEYDPLGLSYDRWNDYLIPPFSSFIKSVHHNQEQLNEYLRHSAVNLSTLYLSSLFEGIKLINNYCMKTFAHCSNRLLMWN